MMHPAIWLALLALDPAVAVGGSADVMRAGAAVIDNAGCRECHNPEGVASDTRLVFPELGAPPKALNDFASDLLELVDGTQPERSRLLRKPTGRMDHAGGEKVAPGTAGDAALRALVQLLARNPDATLARQIAGAGAPGKAAEPGGLRRLTAQQYDNTVRDLLGDMTRPAQAFPPEDYVDGFKNQYGAQAISPVLVEAYSTAAQRLASSAVRAIRGGDPHRILPCGRKRTADCQARFVKDFGRRAFRRPLAAHELTRFSALFAPERDFLGGVRAVIETMLQSPSFLFHVDSKNPSRAAYARANRLSYLLWNTMPDEELFRSAARGELNDAAGVERTARRLLKSPRAQEAVDEFLSQWLRFDVIRGTLKDRGAFPQFTRDTGATMAEETRLFLGDLVWNDRNFLALFTADYSFVNAELAKVYGLPPPANGFARVPYPSGSQRVGIFGQGLFLAATSKPSETSPTARGLFVREHFLCQKVPPPPPSVNMDLPPLSPDAPVTNRQRLAAHLGDPSCAGCHTLIDDIGFGFEQFDAIGGWNERAIVQTPGKGPGAKKKKVELPVDTRGAIAGLKDASFSSAREIGPILARSTAAQSCIARQVFRYAMGRPDTSADRPSMTRIFADFRGSGFRFKELLVSMAVWREFEPPTTTVTEAR